jgi:hypothetical protein
MKLKDLIKKLKLKPRQEDEVEFLVYTKKDGDIVCAQMSGNDTTQIIRILAKRKAP